MTNRDVRELFNMLQHTSMDWEIFHFSHQLWLFLYLIKTTYRNRSIQDTTKQETITNNKKSRTLIQTSWRNWKNCHQNIRNFGLL